MVAPPLQADAFSEGLVCKKTVTHLVIAWRASAHGGSLTASWELASVVGPATVIHAAQTPHVVSTLGCRASSSFLKAMARNTAGPWHVQIGLCPQLRAQGTM